MLLESIEAFNLSIPFKIAFKHASAERKVTQTLWVTSHAKNGAIGFGEGCPREYVSSENLASAHAFFALHLQEWLTTFTNIESVTDWINRHSADIDTNPAAWTAVELSLLDLLGKEENRSVESLLGLPSLTGDFYYTAVLGDASPQQFEAQLNHYIQAGFQQFKIKLSGHYERDLAKVQALKSAGIMPNAVRADANNAWVNADEAIMYLKRLSFDFFALEEPLQAGDIVGMHRIAMELNTRIILDESVLRINQLAPLLTSSDCWIINVRISKMGGLLRSLAFINEARACGLRVIIGAHVGESSLLTRAALVIAINSRDILLAQEGAFGTHLLMYDVVEPSCMFGAGGILKSATYSFADAPGFGLMIQNKHT
ncbi:MAG: enolase C-terminal domain-like protein [Pseudomonadota bacterium]